MKGSYLQPTRQHLYDNWKDFAKKNLMPHTQTCTKCNMVVEITKLSDIDSSRYSYSRKESFLWFECPGCGSVNIFTGGEHLRNDLKLEIIKNYSRVEEPFFAFFKQDHKKAWEAVKFLSIFMVLMLGYLIIA